MAFAHGSSLRGPTPCRAPIARIATSAPTARRLDGRTRKMRAVIAARSVGPAITAVTFDFGNTLVPVGNAALHQVVARTAEQVADASGPFAPADFVAIWSE